jgi:hypothetical protein
MNNDIFTAASLLINLRGSNPSKAAEEAANFLGYDAYFNADAVHSVADKLRDSLIEMTVVWKSDTQTGREYFWVDANLSEREQVEKAKTLHHSGSKYTIDEVY